MVLSDEPVPHNTVEHEPRESQQIEASELPPIRRLDGEVTRMGAHPYAGGTYCEIWEGLWRKHGQGAVGREALGEMVSLSLITSISLTGLFVGGIESASRTPFIGRDAQGLTFADQLCVTCSCLSAVIRGSNVKFRVGQYSGIRISCHSMVRMFPRLFPWNVPTVVQE